ncbi:MAG: ABC transporter ATP-binding protein [Nesterenkonia sp.]|nr:ABC transporter ATP-binding protein [Nesterenkonia sp.]
MVGRDRAAVRAIELERIFGTGEARVAALDGCSVELGEGEFTAVMGPSGSGKSTLLHCLAALDRQTSGTVLIGDTDLAELSDDQLSDLRRDRIGFVFQSFNLVPTLTARENITLPADIGRRPVDEERFEQIVAAVGLQDRLDHFPSQLSGGQQQRVACARALITTPDVIFADEPTGNLDSTSSQAVLDLLRRSVDQHGQTIVMVTHDPIAASRCDRVVFLVDGRKVDEMRDPTPEQILEWMRTSVETWGR